MIAERESEFEIINTLEGERHTMAIEEDAMTYIMNVLIDLYSDKILAIIREYSTNAHDAHVEAGESRPIEVTLPTTLAPFLRIKDYGVGLSADDIAKIYSKYGASTKRGTNDQVGMLGLGCKSALTYSTQFTLVAVKGDERVMVSVSRDEDGTGTMTVVSREETDDHYGVEVIIPIRVADVYTVKTKVNEFFSYWKPNTVLVNGVQPPSILGNPGITKLTDDIYITKNQQSYIVMGNVPYPATIKHNLPNRQGVLVFVDIGKVNFTPSREALQSTKTTKQTIIDIEAAINEHKAKVVKADLDQCNTGYEAIAVVYKWLNIFGKIDKLQWRGHEIPYEYRTFPTDQYDRTKLMTLVPHKSNVLSRHSQEGAVGTTYLTKSLWFYGWEYGKKWTANRKRKLLKWIELEKRNPSDYEYSVLLNEKPDSPWLNPKNIISWGEVEAIKLPRASRASAKWGGSQTPKVSGAYDAWVNKIFIQNVLAKDIDTKNPIFYMAAKGQRADRINKVLSHFYPDYTFVLLGLNRIDKFVRDFSALNGEDEVKLLFQKWKDTLTDDEKLAMLMRARYEHHKYEAVDPKKVDDPELKRYALAARNKSVVDIQSLFQGGVGYYDVHQMKWDDLLKRKYPLFDAADVRNYPVHTYLYLNTIHKTGV